MGGVERARRLRSAAGPLRDRLDRAGINRNYCIATVLAIIGCAVFIIFSVLISTGACHDHTCPKGEEQKLICNCNIARWAFPSIGWGFALLAVAHECYFHEGRRAIMMAKQAVATEGLLDGSTNA